MPLTLLTGPANAAKAGALLGAYRAVIDRAPILVVPNFGDVAVYRRELAEAGVVFGTDVRQFRGLIEEIGRRAGRRGRPVARLARERVSARAIARSRLGPLDRASRTAGFPAYLVDFVVELERARIEPQRLTQALRAWGEGGQYAEDVARLYAAYRSELERLGRADPELAQTAALDALRRDPARWEGTPVFFYGFDELNPIQLDAVDTLANSVGAEVWFSLTYEAGRDALAARARTHQDLVALGAAEQRLPAAAAHATPALHALERGLFDPGFEAVAAKDSVLLLEGGGERAEAELVAARVASLIAQGTPPDEIAVVHRGIEAAAPLLENVFGGFGIPIALRRAVPAGHTALGRGLIALIRCALTDSGSADDLVAYLRTPGLVREPGLVDRLEHHVRREGLRTAHEARTHWESERWVLEALDWLQAASKRGHQALCERLAAEAAHMMARPHERRADVLDAAEEVDARAAAAIGSALRELAALPPALAPSIDELIAALEGLDVYLGADPGPGRVTVAGPLAIRARRVQALFCMGMVQGVFPAMGRPQPFFDDQERRAINAASGLRLRLREDALAVERFFFYLTCSRPERLLALSWPVADDEGKPLVRSLFVDDLLDLFKTPPPVRRRALGEVGWSGEPPTEREAARTAAAGAPRQPEPPIGALGSAALQELRDRQTWSASALEAWIGCPVKWFVEHRLRLESLDPDPEGLVRGQLSHAVLDQALGNLGEPLTPQALPRAKELLHVALSEHATRIRISVNPERLAAEARRLEADLLAYLEHGAENGSTFVPSEFELSFGRPGDDHPPLELFDGELALQGRIDRVDVSPDGTKALVWDYKGRAAPPSWKRWGPAPDGDGKIQIALYMLAVERVLRLEVAGGLYQPLNARRPQARGLVIDEHDPGLKLVNGDRQDRAAAQEVLDACALAARDAVAQIRSGRLEGRPSTCAYRGGCEYPSICRCEADSS